MTDINYLHLLEIKKCGFCGMSPTVNMSARITIIECPRCKKRVYERNLFDGKAAENGAVKLWNKSYGKEKAR